MSFKFLMTSVQPLYSPRLVGLLLSTAVVCCGYLDYPPVEVGVVASTLNAFLAYSSYKQALSLALPLSLSLSWPCMCHCLSNTFVPVT